MCSCEKEKAQPEHAIALYQRRTLCLDKLTMRVHLQC